MLRTTRGQPKVRRRSDWCNARGEPQKSDDSGDEAAFLVATAASNRDTPTLHTASVIVSDRV